MFSQKQTTTNYNATAAGTAAHDPLSELKDYLSLPQESLGCDIIDWWLAEKNGFLIYHEWLGSTSTSVSQHLQQQ